MDVPIGAEVGCVDGACGRSLYAVVDTGEDRVTHVVVQARGLGATQRLVPVALVSSSTPNLIRLRCSRAELDGLEEFTETEFVRGPSPVLTYSPTQYWLWPATVAQPPLIEERTNLPPGEIAIRRGTSVEATDGLVGKVDELLVDPMTGAITHLVLREGMLWGQKDVTIPVSEIARIEEDTVHLKLSKDEIARLPATRGRLQVTRNRE
jgi:sporulation protein YlmC with PRC-barrel domain